LLENSRIIGAVLIEHDRVAELGNHLPNPLSFSVTGGAEGVPKEVNYDLAKNRLELVAGLQKLWCLGRGIE
jgi:hypothetical protein